MSHKPEQLAHEVQHAVQQLLARGLNDPRISGLITITKARVQADLKRAELFVSIFPAERQDLTMHGLKSAAKHLRRQVGDMVRTRSIPELVFVLDESLKKEAAVLRDLQKVRAELESKAASESGTTGKAAQASEPHPAKDQA